MALKIEYVKKEELKTYGNNAKIHTAEQIEQIKKSIAEFGMNDPIAVWHDNEIIEGHGRFLALMEMEDIEEVPIIRLDDLTDEQRKAYMLAHNKLTMNTGFDFSVLVDELKSVVDIDMSEFGFNSFVLDNEFEDFEPEEYDQEIEEEYGENGLKAFNCIISCMDESEKEWLKNILREPKELKRLYDCSRLMENYEKAD